MSEIVKRMYEGAKMSRLTADWLSGGTSADAEVWSSMARLRNRARQVVRDSDHARAAIRTIRNNVIGSGIRFQSQLMMPRVRNGKPRLNQPINDAIERKKRQWERRETFHTGGTLSKHQMSRVALSSAAESGEVFVRIVRQPFGGGRIPLALELIEADQLDETVDSAGMVPGQQYAGGEWRMGVHVDEWQRPQEYAFLTKHPGDTRGSGVSRQRVIVPAADIIHLMVPERPNQTRAVSWFASAIKQLHHLAGYQEAEVVRARAASSLMGFITTSEGTGEELGEAVVDGEHVTQFEPGVFKTLFAGQEVTIPDLHAPDGQFEPFVRAMLRAMAAGLGVSYESISKDFSQSNYSSSRLSILEDREGWKALQLWWIEAFEERIQREFLRAAVSVGELVLPGYEQEPERYEDAGKFVPRGWEWVDPEKEGKAYRDAVRNGFMTQAEVVGTRGGDYHELMERRAAELAEETRLGLVFDTNPTIVNQKGDEQPPEVPATAPPASTATETEDAT